MFSKAFSTPIKANLIIQGAGLIWFLVCAFLLHFYGVDWIASIIDAAIYALIFIGSVFILDRIFSSYVPKGANTWLLLILPLGLSLVGVLFHRYFLQWVFDDNIDYRSFLKSHFYLRWLVLAIVQVMVTLLAIVVSRLEQQEESQKREMHILELSKEAELTQIRQQLQPHFLFNSLNSINALVVSQPQKAREMVLQLSDFLRGTIRKNHQEWITLEEELAYLKMYLDIEKVRFGHRLEVEFDMDKEALEMKLPQLLIQPLLENAIKHGLYGVTGDVKILLKGHKVNNYLVMEGTNPYDPETPSPEGTGFGLSSVERRLYLLFGRSDLLKKEGENGVFTVQLRIPQLK